MSKYEPLSERLRGHGEDEWRASFSDVEQVLGFSLPKGARSRTWWANDPEKSHSRAWAGQGWEVGDLDPTAETVIFRRSAASPAVIQKVAHLEPLAEGARLEAPDVEAAPRPPMAMEPAPERESDPAPSAARGEVAPLSESPRLASSDTAKTFSLPKGVGPGALVAGAAALVIGIGALAIRAVRRR